MANFDFGNTPITSDITLKAGWCCESIDEPFVDKPLASGYGEIEYLDGDGNIQKIAATVGFFDKVKKHAFGSEAAPIILAFIDGVSITTKNLVSYTLGEDCNFGQTDCFFAAANIVCENLTAIYGISNLKKSQLYIRTDGKTLLGPSNMLTSFGPSCYPKLNMAMVFPQGIWEGSSAPLEYWRWYTNSASMPSQPNLTDGKVVPYIVWPDYDFMPSVNCCLSNIVYSGEKLTLPEHLKGVGNGCMGGWYAPNLKEIEVNCDVSSSRFSTKTQDGSSYPAPFTFRGSPAAASIKVTGPYATQFVTKYNKSYFYL